MAPETRCRVYRSSPALQQAQFPSRRKRICTYGRQTADRLRQQTLTQLAFVSDEGGGVVALTDSDDDDDDEGRGKENRRPGGAGERERWGGPADEVGQPAEDAGARKRPAPASSHGAAGGKRRRTLGDGADGPKARDDRTSRRRTAGDKPAAPGRYHTQTLTQLLGHDALIADSDDDDGDDAVEDEGEDDFLEWLGERRRGPPDGLAPPPELTGVDEIPDSDDEDAALERESVLGDDGRDDTQYGAGAETQLVMHALASGEDDRPPLEAPGPTTAVVDGRPSSPSRSQPPESQRVPAAVLRSLPPHTARSDAVLPVGDAALAALLGAGPGARHVDTLARMPDQVVRLWLLARRRLRYVACVGPPAARPAAGPAAGWRRAVSQVYELNDPVDADDMRRHGWVDGPVARYAFLPPAVVGRLLWNLRHALFGDDGDDDDDDDAGVDHAEVNHAHEPPRRPSPSSSDADAAAPKTPAVAAPRPPPSPLARPSTSPPPPPPPQPFRPRLSQATTASQPSTPEKHHVRSHRRRHQLLHYHHSLGGTGAGLADSVASSSPLSVPASQLLSKSQLLSESLVRDRSPPVAKIWDSEDDGEDDDEAPL